MSSDAKSQRSLQSQMRVYVGSSTATSSIHVLPKMIDDPPPSLRLPFLLEIGGMLSVVVAVGLGVYALLVFASYLETDFLVPNFGTAVPVLVAALNHRLAVTGSGAVDIVAPQAAYVPSLQGVSPAYPRLIMYQELTRLLDGVRGLRRLAATQVVMMVSPYCWADLNKTYELAYTVKRQARCKQTEATNGAVHLETVLRNIDFNGFQEATQGLFLSAIAHPIARSGAPGAAWLSALQTHVWTAESDEVALWTSFGLNRYTLQYGTGIRIGVLETVQVETALGQSLLLPLKSMPTTNRWTFRTTKVLYNLLYNDLYAIGLNQSLVRGTTNYFGDIDVSQIEAYAQGLPLRPAQQAIHDMIGSLGSIDAKWMPPPHSLVAAVATFQAAINAHLVAVSSLPAIDMARESLYPTPRRWANPQLRFVSGNPMCTTGTPQSFVQQTFGFDDICSSQTPLTLEWHGFNAAFALWLLGGSVSATDVCAPFPGAPQACERLLADATTLYAAMSPPPLDPSLLSELAALQIGLLQILSTNQAAITIDQQLLLAPDFAFLGAMYLYDWATNFREVVSFQGDEGTHTLVSTLYDAVAADPMAPPAAFGPYLWYLATVTSSTLAALAVLLFGLRCCSSSAGYDWLRFTPLVASVWVSRNLLVFRSVAAILCLATAPLDASTHGLTRLVLAPRSIWISSLLALETLWLAHVAHDVLMPLSDAWLELPIAFMGWFVLVLIDQVAPITPSASLDRQCYAINMDQTTYCASGTVRAGSFHRSVVVTAVVGAVIVASFAWSIWRQRSSTQGPMLRPSAMLPQMAPLHVTATGHQVSMVTAVMCGLVPLAWRDHTYVFDLKLWLALPSDGTALASAAHARVTVLPFSAPSTASRAATTAPSVLRRKSVQRLLRFVGLSYIGVTLWSNTAYLSVLETALGNDFGWPGFNSTGMHAFLANTFNRQLLTSTDATLALHDPMFGDPLQSYNSSATTVTWYPTMARRYLFNASAPLQELVLGLRAMDPCQLPWMFTQYCWLDLDRTWEMASTRQRQVRCTASQHNGARYLETSLRNVQDWTTWRSCWGTSFDVGIGNDLAATVTGRRWLQLVQSNLLSVPEEVDVWKAYGISVFLLQWQNYKDTGLSDAMVITTPFGLPYTLPISERKGVLHLDRQTSHRMYWGLASDLWAVANNATSIGGLSLLRSSPKFAFTNATRAQLLFENRTLYAPLNPGLALYHSSLGPFGAVDMVYVSCPPSLLALYDYVLHAVGSVASLNVEAQTEFLSLPAKTYIGQLPRTLLNDPSLRLVGGNLMCGNDLPGSRPSGALLTLFSADTVCAWRYLDFLTPTTTGLVFALAAFDAVHRLEPSLDFDLFCASDVYAEPNCAAIYAASYAFMLNHLTNARDSFRPLATAAEADLQALSIEMTQYINRSGSMELYRINLLDPSARPWTFFGWNYVTAWVIGQREVVSFQGDGGTVTAISRYTTPASLTLTEAAIPTRLSYVCQQCVRYVTGAIMAGAGVAAYYAIFVCRGHIEGMNLFAINRLIGHAWIGRTLLLVRGVTALWLLNTPSLELKAIGAGARFLALPLGWFPTLLASSELTWLVYIANDLLSCVTRQYTPSYAWKSSVAACVVAAAWTFAVPKHYIAYVHRHCSYVDMDLALVCTSGHVDLGHWSRVSIDVGLCLACVLILALVERLRRPQLPLAPAPSLLLNTTSVYSSNLAKWVVNGRQYMDRMSAAMGGLVTWRYRDVLYVFDIKCWRTFVVEPEAQCPFDVGAVLPLDRIC